MKLLPLVCVTAVLAAFPYAAVADTAVQLIHGTTDASSDYVDVQLLVNADNIATGFQGVTSTTSKTYDLSQIKTGQVLMVYHSYNIAILKSPDFDPAHGGTLEITYLHNAINNDYQSISAHLVRNGNAWEVIYSDQSGNRVITKAFLKANKVLGQIVGIDTVTLN